MSNQTTVATADTVPPMRRRGVFRLDVEILASLIDLPAGQRIIGFRSDPLRLSIDVCVEGDGLPVCPPGTDPRVVNAEPYAVRFSRWATRGADLEAMVRVLAEELLPVESGSLPDLLLRVLDGSYDPRVGL